MGFLFHKEGHVARRSTFYTAFWCSRSHFPPLKFTPSSPNKLLWFSYYSPSSFIPKHQGQEMIQYFLFPLSILPAEGFLTTSLFMFPFRTLYTPHTTRGPCLVPTEQRTRRRMMNCRSCICNPDSEHTMYSFAEEIFHEQNINPLQK